MIDERGRTLMHRAETTVTESDTDSGHLSNFKIILCGHFD